MNDPIKVAVDRRTWYRGKGSDESMLLTKDGQRCCVGFLCQTLGWKDSQIQGIAQISRLEPEEGFDFPDDWMDGPGDDPKETPAFFKLYTTNDDTWHATTGDLITDDRHLAPR